MMLWLVPETAARVANSGREPKALKATQVLVELRQALEVAVWPSASGPAISVVVARPAALVVDGLAGAVIPVALCHAMCWPVASPATC